MPRSAPALARPEMLRWARETCLLAIPDAAARLTIAPQRLTDWERGAEAPSLPQLRRLAELYRRPLACFFLPSPPEEPSVLADFRGRPGSVTVAPELYQELRSVHTRRAIAVELAEALEEPPPVLATRISLSEDPELAGARLREELGVPLALQTSPDNRDDHRSLRLWRSAAERRGILVFQIRGLPTAMVRGFSIASDLYPAIALNPNDALNGRVFTLLHEVVHLAVRQGGLCGADESGLESFCDHVAGSVLMPRPAVEALARTVTTWDAVNLRLGARHFGVSEFALATRLIQLELLTRAEYDAHARRLRGRLASAEKPAGGGSYYRSHVARLGRSFILLVLHAFHRELVTQRDVSNYLDIRLSQLDKLVESVQ